MHRSSRLLTLALLLVAVGTLFVSVQGRVSPPSPASLVGALTETLPLPIRHQSTFTIPANRTAVVECPEGTPGIGKIDLGDTAIGYIYEFDNELPLALANGGEWQFPGRFYFSSTLQKTDSSYQSTLSSLRPGHWYYILSNHPLTGNCTDGSVVTSSKEQESTCPRITCPAPPENCKYTGKKDTDNDGCQDACGELECSEEEKENETPQPVYPTTAMVFQDTTLCGNFQRDPGEECEISLDSGYYCQRDCTVKPHLCRSCLGASHCRAPCAEGVNTTNVERLGTCGPGPLCEGIHTCGDGIVQADESCDSGGKETVTCTAKCKLKRWAKNVCGNGKKEVGEQCDDGARNSDAFTPWHVGRGQRCSLRCQSVADPSFQPSSSCPDRNTTIEGISADGRYVFLRTYVASEGSTRIVVYDRETQKAAQQSASVSPRTPITTSAQVRPRQRLEKVLVSNGSTSRSTTWIGVDRILDVSADGRYVLLVANGPDYTGRDFPYLIRYDTQDRSHQKLNVRPSWSFYGLPSNVTSTPIQARLSADGNAVVMNHSSAAAINEYGKIYVLDVDTGKLEYPCASTLL